MQLACSDHALELGADGNDALFQHAPVELDLRFTGTAEEAASTALALEMGPGAHQAALLVGKMRQLDLQPAFTSSCAPAEDFENEPRAVEHLDVPGALQITLLHRADGMVDDNEAGAEIRDVRLQLFDLAGPEQRRWLRLWHRHDRAVGDLEIDSLGKADSFGETILRRMHRGLGRAAPSAPF